VGAPRDSQRGAHLACNGMLQRSPLNGEPAGEARLKVAQKRTFETRNWAAGFLLILIPLAIVTAVAFWHTSRMTAEAAHLEQALADSELDDAVECVHAFCAAWQKSLERQAIDGVAVGQGVIAGKEGISYSDAAIAPLADEIGRLLWQRCAIFRKVNARGDLVAVSTNVAAPDGSRRVGETITAFDRDGIPNPIVTALIEGATHVGRTKVDNAWFTDAYGPILNSDGELVAALRVSVRQQESDALLAELETFIDNRSEDLSILDAAGRLIFSKDANGDGAALWDAPGARGGLVIDEICRKAALLDPGEVGLHRYRWRGENQDAARCEVARFIAFEPWDWVIGTGCGEAAYFRSRDRTLRAGMEARESIGITAGVFFLAVSLIWFVLARGMARIGRAARLIIRRRP